MGTPEFAVPSLEILIERGERIAAVVTQPDRPQGRGKRVTPPPVKVLAERHGLPVLQPERARRAPFPADLRALAPDLVVVVAYGQILSREVLDIPPLGTINVHASLLPRWRGAAPINWAIAAGDARTGVTTMLLNEGMDAGEMLLRAEVPITAETTAEALTPELARLGAGVLGRTLDALAAGTLRPEPQDEAQVTFAPLLKKEDGFLDLNQSADRVVRRIHAMTPWPGSVVRLGGEPFKLFRAKISDEQAWTAPPGEIIAVGRDLFSVAVAGGEAIDILEVQAPGKRRMRAAEWLAGHRPHAGERLERMEPA
ncbi:MAG: methionyl-tRNA formyltransferase [Myxococcales bacterium]|nr:methionyl-tRNA formyltransferase [Myxococcales bacterium]